MLVNAEAVFEMGVEKDEFFHTIKLSEMKKRDH